MVQLAAAAGEATRSALRDSLLPSQLSRQTLGRQNVRLSSEHRQFLESVAQQNDRANHIDIAGQRRCLVHSFWTIDEILSGLALRSEWDVPDDWIPFHGDWHDLFCLNSTTGAVVSVDDDRRVLHAWPNAESFLNSLSYAVEVDDSDDDDGFVGWQ